ncbi:MAG: nuclear transport factor 2 family protein [Rhizobiaceae bacterium]|nr:nuclear transport factor 2 family protein [Rhizobiaceae bacterium]
MSDDTRIADRLAIRELNDAFAFGLDHGDVDLFLSIFTDEVAYANGARKLAGMAEMEPFFRARAQSRRLSRHIYSGLRIAFDGPDRATGTGTWVTFAGEGIPPVEGTMPFVVSDVRDDYVRGADGRWRIAARTISPVFQSASVPTLAATMGKTA